MIISHSHNFIFIHVHKTAGESITEALSPHLGYDDVVLGNRQSVAAQLLSTTKKDSSQLRKHSDALTIMSEVSPQIWDQYFKFTFARHPVDRALSLYHYLKRVAERRHSLGRNIWYSLPKARTSDPRNWAGMKAFLETDCFSEFIRHPEIARAPGMRPQWQSVCDHEGNMLVDFVGHFEELEGDFAKVLEKVGIQGAHLPQKNRSQNTPSRRSQLPADDLELLYQSFQMDYSLFGYEP